MFTICKLPSMKRKPDVNKFFRFDDGSELIICNELSNVKIVLCFDEIIVIKVIIRQDVREKEEDTSCQIVLESLPL